MVVGIGTDIADVRRIAAVLARQGERFAQRVLGPSELLQWEKRTARQPDRGTRYLATRFSAKEAFSKAIGLGMHSPMAWSRCEILNQSSGQPMIVLNGELKTWFEAKSWHASVSLSDETDYAVSFVVVEYRAPEFAPLLNKLET